MARERDRPGRVGWLNEVGVAIVGAVIGSAVAQVAFDGTTLVVAVCAGVGTFVAMLAFYLWSARRPEHGRPGG